MGRKKMADGKQRVLATRVDEEVAGKAEEAAGDEGVSAWLRELVGAALEWGKADEKSAEEPAAVKAAVQVDPNGPAEAEEPEEEPADDDADEHTPEERAEAEYEERTLESDGPFEAPDDE